MSAAVFTREIWSLSSSSCRPYALSAAAARFYGDGNDVIRQVSGGSMSFGFGARNIPVAPAVAAAWMRHSAQMTAATCSGWAR
jgi:hypothetical protein